MSDREREILHAELRGSAAEFMGWLTGLKPPEEKEAIPPKMRGAFDRMVERMQSAVMRCANERAEWHDISTAPKDEILLVAAPEIGALPLVAWKVEGTWYEYGVYGKELRPQPTIWTRWPKMPRGPLIADDRGTK